MKIESGKIAELFKSRKIEVVIFDYDHVLGECVYQGNPFNDIADQMANIGLGQDHPLYERLKKVTFGESTDWISVLESIGFDVSDRGQLEIISDVVFLVQAEHIVVYSWVGRIIPALAKLVKLAISSNNSRKAINFGLNEMVKYFACIKTFENVTHLKPNPESLLAVCQELHIEPDRALLIGDSKDDVIAALLAGVNIAIVPWGQNRPSFWQKEIMSDGYRSELPAPVIDDLSHPQELLELFERTKNLHG